MKVKVIVIDADHTLHEFDKKKKERAYREFYKYLSKKLNIQQEIIGKFFLETVGEIKESKNPKERKREYSLKKTLDKLGLEYSEEIIINSLKIFWNELLNSIIVKEGVIEFLEKYKDSYTIGIFTDEFKEIVEKKLEKVFGKWKKYFKFLITPEITNEMKPSEKYYDKILEITNVKEKEVAVFGNSWEKDLRIAKDKGIFTVLISNKKKGFPDIFVKDFKELDEKKIF